ncbi:DUF456 domain-containing protein [Serinibacter arcticus]|uniref:DUF456 domain-containing protein n=1 Tax=Serinibacter arcticus TaxID=1655435 RepID=A0A2U1ZTS7_9MICO|nr:DUF456 domain-containing protein [Serinibacter arcticus]PWD50389.1 DUF456 domain-containing protein [Serinibacter arcticus]
MPLWGEVLVGLAVLVGLVGVVVQVLPGALLVGGAVLVWGLLERGAVGWTVAALAVLLTAAGQLVKYLLAGRYLKRGGVPTAAMVWGGLLGIVGFFVIPVVGVFIGFPLGVYLAERVRLEQHDGAWRSTVLSLKATGLTIVIELLAALLVTVAWIAGLLLTRG